MKYISPFTTLGVSSESQEIDPKELRRLKKRLLTEFELQDSVTILLNGHEMDKTAILAIFQQLENQQIFSFHSNIFKHKSLLVFLEKGDIQFFENDNWHLITFNENNQDFQQFIHPYFSSQFDKILNEAVKAHNVEKVKQLSQIALHLPFDYEGDCFKSSYRYLISEAKKLREISKRNYLQERNFKKYITKKSVEFFNALPDYFIDVRIRICESLESIALQMNNKHDNTKLARRILRRGLALNTNETVRYQLQYILDQLNHMPEKDWGYGSPTANPRRSSTNIRISWVVLVIVILYFLRLFVIPSNFSSREEAVDVDEIMYDFANKQLEGIGLVNAITYHNIVGDSLTLNGYKNKVLSVGERPYSIVSTLESSFFDAENDTIATDEVEYIIKNTSPWQVIILLNKSFEMFASYLPANEEMHLKLPLSVGYNLYAYAGENWLSDYPLRKDYVGIFQKNRGLIELPNVFLDYQGLQSTDDFFYDKNKWLVNIEQQNGQIQTKAGF